MSSLKLCYNTCPDSDINDGFITDIVLRLFHDQTFISVVMLIDHFKIDVSQYVSYK
jgi:hypothetical protein